MSFTLNDDSQNTTTKIMAEAMTLKMQGKLDAIFVDYMQILKDPLIKGENVGHELPESLPLSRPLLEPPMCR